MNIWESWPVEMPTAPELRECKEYQYLQDEGVQREMASELRDIAIKTAHSKFPTASKAAIILKGGMESQFSLYDSDTDHCTFRQEAFFRYLFGINEPDCYGILDLERKESVLFVPRVLDDWQRWHGAALPLDYYTKRYGVTTTRYVDELHTVLQERGLELLYVLRGVNSDSGLPTATVVDFAEVGQYKVDEKHLHPMLCEMRVFKTKREIEYMRVCNVVSCQAHVYVMRHIKAGMTELQCEALFKAWTCYFGAARHMAYTCICGSGPHGSILHYGHAGRPNDRILKDGDTIVLDMGAEFFGYSTDITRSYAINGKFTEDQKAVHQAVYEAQHAVFKAMKPGVSWPDMHRLAERVLIQHLIKIGILHNGTEEEMVAAHMGAVFQPHGLGHLLGLNVHDVGGYPEGTQRLSAPGVSYLRTSRTLQPGMVLTVEPGLYFNDPTLNKALANPDQAKFINEKVLDRFRGTGGFRLEDDVVVTEDGIINLTTLPTSWQECEAVIQAAQPAQRK